MFRCAQFGYIHRENQVHEHTKPIEDTLKLEVVWKSRIRHLGNLLCSDLTDDADIAFKKGVFISQINKLNLKFPFVSGAVKCHLFQTYCCSWYRLLSNIM